jgi:hypothetical protein
MDKQVDGLAGALREIAEERDNQLRKAGAISADRIERLQAFLAAEFPVETALDAAARQRDASLSVAEPALPLAVQAALREQLRSARAAPSRFEVLRHFLPWLETPSLRRAFRAASLAAAAIIVALTMLHFSHSRNPVTRTGNQSRPSSIVDQNPTLFSPNLFFDHSDDRLSLRMTRLELASLEPSFITINRALPDSEQTDRVLSLELPIRQIRLDVETARTP